MDTKEVSDKKLRVPPVNAVDDHEDIFDGIKMHPVHN
jgi:hypothetical protein